VLVIDPSLHAWLTSPDHAAVRYLYARDIVPPAPGEPGLDELRAGMLDWRPLRALLESQGVDGGFAPAQKGFPARVTYWALDMMARCGMDVRDESVDRALAWLEARYVHRGAFSYNGGGSGVIPCYVGNATRNVIALAGHDRASACSAIQWLVDHQRFDHKQSRAGGDEPWPFKTVDSYGGCWWSVSCYHGVVSALRGLAAVPPEHRTGAVQARIDAAMDYLRIHRVYKRSSVDRPLFRHLTQFFLLGDYRLHLIDVLEALAEADPGLANQAWVAEAIDAVDALAAGGRIPLVKNYGQKLVDPDLFETVGQPSRLLTLQWLRTRQRFGLG
jgi:hypothetical protein